MHFLVHRAVRSAVGRVAWRRVRYICIAVRPGNNAIAKTRWRGKWAFTLTLFVISSWSLSALPPEAKLSTPGAYRHSIDPLLNVTDFRTSYYEDGAADASVLFPESSQKPYEYLMPAEPVAALVRLHDRGLPLLIDCLSDGRITRMRFEGNAITQPMNVPIGYVCLDILMGEVHGNPVSDSECADDGLGACMSHGYYFRPDDYYGCTERDCLLRPWVLVVQRTWRKAYLAHRLRYRNPYDAFPADEYKQLQTGAK